MCDGGTRTCQLKYLRASMQQREEIVGLRHLSAKYGLKANWIKLIYRPLHE